MMREMMKGHIDQTTTYAVHLLKKDYESTVKEFDKAFAHMSLMSEELSAGWITQFPAKFEVKKVAKKK
jgi:hypothetical protein